MRIECLKLSLAKKECFGVVYWIFFFFNTTLNIRVTKDRVTASTSSTKCDKLRKQTAGNHSAEALELLLREAGC